MAASTLKNHSNRYNCDSEQQDCGKNNIRENANVRVLRGGSDLDKKQKDDADQAGDNDRDSNEADIVSKKAWSFSFYFFFVTHNFLIYFLRRAEVVPH